MKEGVKLLYVKLLFVYPYTSFKHQSPLLSLVLVLKQEYPEPLS